MKITKVVLGLLLVFNSLSLLGQTPEKKMCVQCDQLAKSLHLPDVTILKVESHTSDTIKSLQPWLPSVIIKVPFCRLLGRIGKETNFELLLPQQWNGRFLMSGGGGFSGSIENGLKDYVNRGYATAGTDTGHQGDGLNAEWALNNMERQLNFGRTAIHMTTAVSKSIIFASYCADPSFSYFLGCSRGGGQAMVEAQFYPDDFDGIVAGAPAFSWPAIAAQGIRGCQSIFPDPKDPTKRVITSDNLKLLQDYILKQCDNLDGVTDRILNDPRECKIDLSKLPVCVNNISGKDCFTKEQLAAIKTVYNPLVIDNQQVHPGFPVGLEGESGAWDFWITGTDPYSPGGVSLHYFFANGIFKYLIYNDPSWDYTKYDFKNYFEDTQYASSYLDATQTDYGRFKTSKAKMIMYHGWNDAALSAYATIQHYEEAQKKDSDLQSYFRLFLLPGVLHCGGGTGPDDVDWIVKIQDWVENGKAPERIVISKIENGKVAMTRPVFPYPKMTTYSGKGDVKLEQNFKVKTN